MRPLRPARPGLGVCAVLVLLTVLAVPAAGQRGAVPRVGVLLFGSPATDANYAAFLEGMRELGYVEGRDVVLEPRFAAGRPERLPGLARELVSLEPRVIFALGGDVAPAVKAATTTIPVVFVASLDPVQSGLVAALARPGGNLTGVTLVSADLAPKRLQFLREAAPGITRVGVLWSPAHPDLEYRATVAAARPLGIQIQSLEVNGPADFDAVLRTAAAGRLDAVIVASSRLMTLNRQHIVDFAARHRILLVSGWGPWAETGALLSYGPNLDAAVRRATMHVDRILKGARAGDLPVEQPTKFEIVLNLKTARAYGLTIPSSLAARADRVIDP